MPLRTTLFRVTSLALLVKLAGAPLNYLMLVALARAMDLEGYGVFAFGFSAALTLGQIALMGQQQLVMRVLPANTEPENAPVWKAALAYGLRHVAGAGAVLTLAFALYSLADAENRPMLAAALLVLPIAFAEFQSSVLRTQNRILSALVPRDILWRLSVIAAAGLVMLGILPQLEPTGAFLLCAGTLAFWLLVQSRFDPATRYRTAIAGPRTPHTAEWRGMSKSFWLASVVIVSGPNLAVVAIGLVMSPEKTAPFFAALKTAQLMTLLLLAANLAVTPMISRAYAEGARGTLRKICQSVSAAAGGFAALGMVAFWAFGGFALSLFGAGYATAKPELLILSFGFAVSAAGGPNGILMQMAGQEKAFARLSLIWNAAGLAALVPAVWAFGTLGAASVVALSTIAWNVHAWYLCRSRIGIDPSLLGFILPRLPQED
ncbi:lipopolysaccharide biosynthesis protein [Leisingera caerulea]|uniref:lipopolysaccharide biosynthesis protein n=1 Tax=Leisingera caerulea TaxID=506591 RepID=UPI0021A51467|nr:lipopolysaccharide biosynthesis protein [Leisingera caerulea]UWQ83337.1 lipopolysaccharide biosynthesis protein [Leisingera caerulea]